MRLFTILFGNMPRKDEIMNENKQETERRIDVEIFPTTGLPRIIKR